MTKRYLTALAVRDRSRTESSGLATEGVVNQRHQAGVVRAFISCVLHQRTPSSVIELDDDKEPLGSKCAGDVNSVIVP